jgi:hypothetical protein
MATLNIDDQARVMPPKPRPTFDGWESDAAGSEKSQKPAREEQIARSVQKEIKALERFSCKPDLPSPIKQQYDLASHRLKRFAADVKNGRDPREAYREHVVAARRHLREARREAVKLLQRQAGDVATRYSALRPALSAEEQSPLQPHLDILTRFKEGKLSAKEAKALNGAIAELEKNMPPLAKQVQARDRGKLLRSIREVRGPLKQLLAADEKVGVQGRVAKAPWFSGLAYQFAANPAFRQGTTLADRLRATKNPEAARSVADLLLSLDQLESDVRSGRPLSPDRLRDLQRIAQHPAIARTQSAVAVGAVVEAAKTVAISSAIVVAGAFTGGLAGEAFAAYAGPGAISGLGALLTEGAVFTAVTAPLNYAAGLGGLPNGISGWAGQVVSNTSMIGTFKIAGKAYESFAGTYKSTAPVLHEIGKLGTSFTAMNGFALGEQLVRGEDPELVFSWSNVGNQAVNALPMFIGLEASGRLARPLLAPLRERIIDWRANRPQWIPPEFVIEEVDVAELARKSEVSAEENTKNGKLSRDPNWRPKVENRAVVDEEITRNPRLDDPLVPKEYGPELKFQSLEELMAFIKVTEGNLPGAAQYRARLAAEHPGEPAYEVDARLQAGRIWRGMSPEQKDAVRHWLGGRVTADRLIENAGDLLLRDGKNLDYQELVRIKVELNGLKIWGEQVAPKHGIKPAWMNQLILEDHWLTAEVSNFHESKPVGRVQVIGAMRDHVDTVVGPEGEKTVRQELPPGVRAAHRPSGRVDDGKTTAIDLNDIDVIGQPEEPGSAAPAPGLN